MTPARYGVRFGLFVFILVTVAVVGVVAVIVLPTDDVGWNPLAALLVGLWVAALLSLATLLLSVLCGLGAAWWASRRVAARTP